MKPREHIDDAQRIRQAKEGDMEAFEALVRKYQRRIYGLCRRMTGAHQSADDLSQETFVKAYFALAGFDERFEFYSWIRRIAVNSALNYIKSRKREKPWPDNEAGIVEAADRPSRSGRPEESVENARFEERLAQAIETLPPGLKSVFILRFYEDQSYGEISQTLHIPAGTVMSRLNRARRRLKAILAHSVREDGLK